MTDPVTPNPEPSAQPVRRKRGPLARIGCGLGLVLWFALIMTPCFIFMLASRGELSLNLGSAPGQTARVWLVMEEDARGIGWSLPSVRTADNGSALCVQTDVRYLFWQGEADPISYCECYERAADGSLDFSATHEGACTDAALSEAAGP